MIHTPKKVRLPQYLFLLIVSLTVLISAAPVTVPESASVVEKIIAAYGGRERLSKVKAIAAEGRITAIMRSDEGTYRHTLRRDGNLFVDIVYSRSSGRRTCMTIRDTGHRRQGRRSIGSRLPGHGLPV
jgi:hypothetical protein